MQLFQKTNKKNIVANNKGFTLIEIVIVIVLIGGLAAYFVPKLVSVGAENSAKSGGNTILEDLRQIADAAVSYSAKTTQEVATTAEINTKLVAGNYLTAIPVPNDSYKDSAYTGAGYVFGVDAATYTTQFGTAAADTVSVVTGVTKLICQKIDEQTGLIAAGANPPAAVTAGKDPQCFGSGGATGYTVLKLMYAH